MPATAQLRMSINGGAVTSGGVTVANTDTVQLSAVSTAFWSAAGLWEIYSYPSGFSVPAGWSTDAADVYYYLGNTPPVITMPAAPDWGKWLFRLTANGGGTADLTDEASGVQILGPSSVKDVAPGETTQFGGARRAWAGDLSDALHILAAGGGGGGVASTRQIISGTGLTGGGDLSADRTLNVVANADGSILANANDVQVGVLATDAQHGARGGGTQHAAATGAAAGFMSAADKTKLDANSGLTSAAPANVTKAAAAVGVSTEIARADHKHDVTTAAAVAVSMATSTEGAATSLARSDHTHQLPATITTGAINERVTDAGVLVEGIRLEDNGGNFELAAIGPLSISSTSNFNMLATGQWYAAAGASNNAIIDVVTGQKLLVRVNSIDEFRVSGAGVETDAISEITAAAGITADGVLLKDSAVTAEAINEKTQAFGLGVNGLDFHKEVGSTVNATPNTIMSVAIPSGSGWTVKTFFTGKSSDAIVSYERTATFMNVAGTTSQVGSTTSNHTAESAGLAACDVSMTANDTTDEIDFIVTGINATTINWEVVAMIQKVA